jgi:hypothetical protein
MQDYPLIVPSHKALCLLKHVCLLHALTSERVDDLVVKLEEGHVQLRDEEMHIIALIAKQRNALTVPGKIIRFAYIVQTEKKFIGVVEVIKIRVACRTCSIEAFEIQARRAEVAEFVEAGMMQ